VFKILRENVTSLADYSRVSIFIFILNFYYIIITNFYRSVLSTWQTIHVRDATFLRFMLPFSSH